MHSTTGPALADLTTLGLGGPCRDLVTVTDPAQLVAFAGRSDVLVVGGGSNLVVADEGVDATVVRIAIPGLRVDGDEVVIGAGENWDDVVAALVADGWCGLAPLSGIPGAAGSTPVQNVGAYGTEIAELLTAVTLFDRRTGVFSQVSAADLGLAYRTSRLKGRADEIVVEVRLALPREPRPIGYAELARVLGVAVGDRADERAVRAAVLDLRRGKGMVLDPADRDTCSAGSFFTNPLVTDDVLAQVRAVVARRHGAGAAFPYHPSGDGRWKLSAAWLIERAGFTRGYPGGGARIAVSGKHTLALTNRGGGTTAELLALAREIRDGVRAAFGVVLHPEPVLVGVNLD